MRSAFTLSVMNARYRVDLTLCRSGRVICTRLFAGRYAAARCAHCAKSREVRSRARPVAMSLERCL
jgi:hypothetical protein